ncbi:microtubule-associated protein tau-like isoform X2 [Hoplias malabaricus]|uniref:microtubule-associated protein tau-like isoform X2 n=1 Tax=Hoplias malabaricus TaxID=27720 RepID=UPI003461B9DC
MDFNPLNKDFVASPEAKSFDNKAGEKMDGKSGAFPGSGLSGMSGGQTGNQFHGFLGQSCPGAPEKPFFSSDISGFSQPAMNMSANMNVGMAPLQSAKPPSLTEPQKTSALHANEPPKPVQTPSNPFDTRPHNTSDNSAVWGKPWTGEDMLSKEQSHSPNKPELSTSKPLGIQGYEDQDTTSMEESNDGGQHKRKKKCDDMEEAYGLLESLRSPEKALSKSTDQGDSPPPSPGESWKSEIREWGGGRIQAKKSKSRKKLPEEWATSSPSPPLEPSTLMVTDMDICTDSAISTEQRSAMPSFTTDSVSHTTPNKSVVPVASQAPSAAPDPTQSIPVVTASSHASPDFSMGFKTTADSIPSPKTSTACQNSSSMSGPAPSPPVTSSTVVSHAASPSLTSLTKQLEPPLAKSPQLQVKETLSAKEKTEKTDTSPKIETSSMLGKVDKTEKTDTSNKKTENLNKDHKPVKNEKVEKLNNEGKEVKKNGNEKVDKTVKNEKNEKAGKTAVKSPTANGKGLISPDKKAKTDKQNSTKPNLHSSGENLANKKGPTAKTTTSTTGTKKPPGTNSARDAKTPENITPRQRKPPVPKFNNNTHTARGSSAKTHTSSSVNDPASPANNGTQTPRPSRITKPPVPKQVPLPRKPPVPRAPRNTRVTNAPMPDLKNVASKIGSTDNMKYQPGGGKIQIVHKKLDFSHVTSRCGSKDNIKHVPGGGNVQILNKKVDISKVNSKCGSKDNIKDKLMSGGDDEMTDSAEVDIKNKAKNESPDSVGHEPGGNQLKAGGNQQKSEVSSPASTAKPPTQADKGTKENGMKESSSAIQEGHLISQGLDKRIPATN